MTRALAVLILVLLLAPPVQAGASDPPAAAALQERRAQMQRLLDQLMRSRQRLREVRQRERRVVGELEDIDRSREAAERRLEELARERSRSQSAAQAAATQVAATERRLATRRGLLQDRLRTIYKYGRTGYVDVLLGANDPGEFLTRWHFITTIVRADGRLITQYAEDVEEYRALQATLRQEQARLAAIAAQTEARRREIVAREAAKRAALTRLQEERGAYERMTRELEEDSRQLEALIRRAQGAGARGGVALARSLAGFIWPARGAFTSGFGIRRHPIFGIRRMHNGQDIAAPHGTPVQAAADGRVIYTGWFGGYGRIVIIDHGQNISTLYAHLSQILTRTGAQVRQGQAIGRVGSTGYATGPHVHFEVRVDGRPIDPARR